MRDMTQYRRCDGMFAARIFVLTKAFHAQNKEAKDMQLEQKEVSFQLWLDKQGIVSTFTPDSNEHADNFDADMNLLIDYIIVVCIHLCSITHSCM